MHTHFILCTLFVSFAGWYATAGLAHEAGLALCVGLAVGGKTVAFAVGSARKSLRARTLLFVVNHIAYGVKATSFALVAKVRALASDTRLQ